MTRTEFDAIVYLFKGWKGGFDDDAEEAYWAFLQGYDQAEVLVALKRLIREGPEFVPSVPAIVQAMEPPAPAFDEIWPGVVKALSNASHCTGYAGTGPTFDDEATLADIEARSGRLAAAWCSSYGLSRLRHEPVNDPDHGGAVLHRLRADFVERTAQASSRDHLLLALDAPRFGSGELRRFDPAALIGGPS